MHNNQKIVLAKEHDLGAGWKARKDKGNTSTETQDHMHVWNPKTGKWAQNKDGSVHDQHANSPGEPPGWVQKELKKKTGWDWDKNKKQNEQDTIKQNIIPIPPLLPEFKRSVTPAVQGTSPTIFVMPRSLIDWYEEMMEKIFETPQS